MRNDYQRMQEEILPGKETREWMWESIEQQISGGRKRKIQKRGFKLAVGIAAIMLVLTIALPQTSWGDEIKGFLLKYFYMNNEIGDHIVKNVYEDYREHVGMRIQEMVSDGACLYFDICYEAYDPAGRDWLGEQTFNEETIRFGVLGEEGKQSAGYTWSVREQEERSTESTRHFTVFIFDFTGNFNLKNDVRTLFYPMYRSQGIGEIKLKSNMETVKYRLVGEESPSEFYVPDFLIVSQLSFGIFGKNKGAIIHETACDGSERIYMSEGFLEEPGCFDLGLSVPISFTLKDGSKVPVSEDTIASGCDVSGIAEADIMVASGRFHKVDEDYLQSMIIDPEELTGLDLFGVHYDLVKE